MSSWQPNATLDAIRQRAALNRSVRAFFAKRNVMEVETPLLMSAQAAEQHLHNFELAGKALQTSPESAMKRLLCAGSGPIYQICKAFRLGELGARHNPEFTMLEWYQPDYSFSDIILETLAIIESVLGERQITRYVYCDIFEDVTALNPHTCSMQALSDYVKQNIDGMFEDMSRSDWLDLIMSQCVEPVFEFSDLTVVVDFPACQAALAKTEQDPRGHLVARRFEVYSGGLELANGYDELCEYDQLVQALNGADSAMEQAFMESDLARCCGVALGMDRLLMLSLAVPRLSDVLSFDFERA